MPIDTPNDLMSALGTPGPPWWMPPIPTGGIDQADRQQVVGTYAGVLAAGGVESGALASIGGGVATFAGIASYAGAVAATGSGTAAFDGSYAPAGSNLLLAAGGGSAAFDGVAETMGSLAAAGIGVATFAGTAAGPAPAASACLMLAVPGGVLNLGRGGDG